MSAEETVYVAHCSDIYHTNDDCPRLATSKRPEEWSRSEADEWGKRECTHCQRPSGGTFHGEQLSSKLAKADPEDLGLSPTGERASASLSFVAWWLAVLLVCTASVVALYCGGAFA